jgi:hypothetical protein
MSPWPISQVGLLAGAPMKFVAKTVSTDRLLMDMGDEKEEPDCGGFANAEEQSQVNTWTIPMNLLSICSVREVHEHFAVWTTNFTIFSEFGHRRWPSATELRGIEATDERTIFS